MTLPAVSARGIASGHIVRRKADGSCEAVTDEVTSEEPLEIRIGNQSVAVTMRTPGHDEELAAGFLLSEGIVRARAQLRDISHAALADPHGNVVNVILGSGASFDAESAKRFGTISTSCGLCGKTSIAAVHQHFPPLTLKTADRITAGAILELPRRLQATQGDFARTGGIHAAAIFDLKGNLLVGREDIGRHNAVDKAIGRAFLDDLVPLKDHVLMVSGRASFEIVQKALAAGIAIIASVSAPSTLAITFARESGQTLIGFLRPPTFNIYSHIERVALDQS